MINIFVEQYRNGGRNSSIAASGIEYFGQGARDKEAKQRYGSFNKLVVLSQATTPLRVTLDDNTSKAWDLPSTGSFEIEPEEGLFFNTIKVTNLSSSTEIGADKISVTWARAIPSEVR